MDRMSIKPYDVIANKYLPEQTVDQLPADGDPFEINGELYFVCESIPERIPGTIDVIPLIVKDPAKVPNIKKYISCLSFAHRRILFRNSKGSCGLEACDEMIIS